MGGIIYWIIRAAVMVAFYAFIVVMIPALKIDTYLDALPDFTIYWINYFILPTVWTIVVAPDAAIFVMRRFNP